MKTRSGARSEEVAFNRAKPRSPAPTGSPTRSSTSPRRRKRSTSCWSTAPNCSRPVPARAQSARSPRRGPIALSQVACPRPRLRARERSSSLHWRRGGAVEAFRLSPGSVLMP